MAADAPDTRPCDRPHRIAWTESIWQDVETPVFWAWWPSQFLVADPSVHVLAGYEEAQPDAFSSDIPVADGGIIGWSDLERRYQRLIDRVDRLLYSLIRGE